MGEQESSGSPSILEITLRSLGFHLVQWEAVGGFHT